MANCGSILSPRAFRSSKTPSMMLPTPGNHHQWPAIPSCLRLWRQSPPACTGLRLPDVRQNAHHRPTGRRSACWPDCACTNVGCSSIQLSFSRLIVDADSPGASRPSSAVSASPKSPVDMPFRYNHGSNSSMALVRRRYGGSIAELNLISLARSRTRGALTSISPSPVWIVRPGR